MINSENLHYTPVLNINQFNENSLMRTYADQLQQAEIEEKLKIMQLARRLGTQWEVIEKEDMISSSFISFVNPKISGVMKALYNLFFTMFNGQEYKRQINGTKKWNTQHNRYEPNKVPVKNIVDKLYTACINEGLTNEEADAVVSPFRASTKEEMTMREASETALLHNKDFEGQLRREFSVGRSPSPNVKGEEDEGIRQSYMIREQLFKIFSEKPIQEFNKGTDQAGEAFNTSGIYRNVQKERDYERGVLPNDQIEEQLEKKIGDYSDIGTESGAVGAPSTQAVPAGDPELKGRILPYGETELYKKQVSSLVNIIKKAIDDQRLELQPDTTTTILFEAFVALLPSLTRTEKEELENLGLIRMSKLQGQDKITHSITTKIMYDVLTEIRRIYNRPAKEDFDFKDRTTTVDEAREATETREEFLSFGAQLYQLLMGNFTSTALFDEEGKPLNWKIIAGEVAEMYEMIPEGTPQEEHWRSLFESDKRAIDPNTGTFKNFFIQRKEGDFSPVGVKYFGLSNRHINILEKLHKNIPIDREEDNIMDQVDTSYGGFMKGYFYERNDTLDFENSLRNLQQTLEGEIDELKQKEEQNATDQAHDIFIKAIEELNGIPHEDFWKQKINDGSPIMNMLQRHGQEIVKLGNSKYLSEAKNIYHQILDAQFEASQKTNWFEMRYDGDFTINEILGSTDVGKSNYFIPSYLPADVLKYLENSGLRFFDEDTNKDKIYEIISEIVLPLMMITYKHIHDEGQSEREKESPEPKVKDEKDTKIDELLLEAYQKLPKSINELRKISIAPTKRGMLYKNTEQIAQQILDLGDNFITHLSRSSIHKIVDLQEEAKQNGTYQKSAAKNFGMNELEQISPPMTGIALLFDILAIRFIKWFDTRTNNKINKEEIAGITEAMHIEIITYMLLGWQFSRIRQDTHRETSQGGGKLKNPVVKQVAIGSGIKKKLRTEKPTGKIITNVKDAEHRFNIIIGSIKAGNNSKDLINELSSIVDYLYDNNKMTKSQYQSMIKMITKL